MVFKPFTTLARQSLSKHLVGGYAQSVVAASQSSYASSTLPIHRIGQNNAPARLQNAFGGSNSGSTTQGRDGTSSDGLGSFYAAKGDGLDENKESKKYLFSRKILWSRAQHQEQQKKLLETPKPIDEGLLPLSRSNSILTAASEADIDAIRAEAAETKAEDVLEADESLPTVASREAVTQEPLPEPSASKSPVEQYNRQLNTLRDEGRYPEVSAVFQHMLQEGVEPNTATYNFLLSAVVKLDPRGVSDVVEVYKDMLRRKLTPNTSTYSILIEFLASRAIKAQRLSSSLEADAARFGAMLSSTATKVGNLKSEDSLNLALDLFYASTDVRERVFPDYVYSVLIQACSRYGRDDDMIKVYAHLERHDVEPSVEVMQSLIRGFGQLGNLNSAVETYNAYSDMDVAHDPVRIAERYQMYQDLIMAYMRCDESAGALEFLEKILETSREPERCEALAQAVVEGFLAQNDVDAAKHWLGRQSVNSTQMDWLSRIIVKAADMEQLKFGVKLYALAKELGAHGPSLYSMARAQMALLAVCVKGGMIDESRELWYDLTVRNRSAGPDVPAAMAYITMLFRNGLNNEALVVLNQFTDFYLNKYVPDPESSTDNYFMAKTKIATLEELYEHFIVSLAAQGLLTPSIALDIAGFSWTRCNGLKREASMRVLDMFDGARLLGLTTSQLSLIAQLQTNILDTTAALKQPFLPEDVYSFERIFNIAVTRGQSITGEFLNAIEKGVSAIGTPELSSRWSAFLQNQWKAMSPAATPFEQPTPVSPVELSPSVVQAESDATTLVEDNYDPYWAKTDIKSSVAIENIIERSKMSRITELRRMYRGTRKAGKAVRMTTLGKLVTAAARAGAHEDFIDEIYRNAKADMPLLSEHSTSRFGWCVLLDAMVAAQLNLHHTERAAKYHDELLKMGYAPSANTYGLYIVSLKGSHQTFDEASEAVKIFARAKTENVLPSSFLYNALIGKLAKARRVDDCLYYFGEMRALNIKPTSVTYGTMINALTRVGDEVFAEELFQEMEAMPNYKPRAAPYNSLMQFFISTKRDRIKVLSYYSRMCQLGIQPTPHTNKLLIEAYATLDPPDMLAAEELLESMRASGGPVESAHHAALIHAKGCVLHDVPAAIAHFNAASAEVRPDSTLYQALLETLVANHRVHETSHWVQHMHANRVSLTPYIANTLIHGWALEKNITKARELYEKLSPDENAPIRREPSTYEAMTRAYLAVEDRQGAMKVVTEMRSRGYPAAVMARVLDLVKAQPAQPQQPVV